MSRKLKISSKLGFNRETLRRLTEENLAGVRGGADDDTISDTGTRTGETRQPRSCPPRCVSKD